jgi:hypothetical protein
VQILKAETKNNEENQWLLKGKRTIKRFHSKFLQK